MQAPLSKSDLGAFRQCPRRLWLEHHAPDRAGPGNATTWRRARDGAIVGEKARELLGSRILWPRAQASPGEAASFALAALHANPDSPAVEVPLLRDGLFARADALIPESGTYVLQETKSSTFPLKKDKLTPDKPDDHHLDDIAIQLWVLEASGLPLARAELNLLNNQWRYPGNGDYRGLFRSLPIDASIRERVDQVSHWLAAAQQALAGAMPVRATGKHCAKPYPCPFLDHCRALDPPMPAHPLELLPGTAGKNLARKLRETRGYESLLEPEPT